MNPLWMWLVVVGTAVFAILIYRAPQARPTPRHEENTEPPRRREEPPKVRPVPPPLPLRRRLPPLVRAVARLEPPAPPPPVAVVPVVRPAPVAAPAIALKKPQPVMLELMQMLKNKQSLQAAILLREVLDPPLCRRRR